MLESELLGGQFVLGRPVHGNGRRFRVCEPTHNGGPYLHSTGGHLRIPAVGRSLHDGPDDTHDILGTELVGEGQ